MSLSSFISVPSEGIPEQQEQVSSLGKRLREFQSFPETSNYTSKLNLSHGLENSFNFSSISPEYQIPPNIVNARVFQEKDRRVVLEKLNRIRIMFPEYSFYDYSRVNGITVEELNTIYKQYSSTVREDILRNFKILQETYQDEVEIEIPDKLEYLERMNEKFKIELKKVMVRDVIKKREMFLIFTLSVVQFGLNKVGFEMDGYIKQQMKNMANYKMILSQGINVQIPGSELIQNSGTSPMFQLIGSITISTLIFAGISYVIKNSFMKGFALSKAQALEKEIKDFLLGEDDALSKMRRAKNGEDISSKPGLINKGIEILSNTKAEDLKNPAGMMKIAASIFGSSSSSPSEEKEEQEEKKEEKPKRRPAAVRKKLDED